MSVGKKYAQMESEARKLARGDNRSRTTKKKKDGVATQKKKEKI